MSLCHNCDWMGHSTSNTSTAHKRQNVNCYSGCPSASELSQIWSFLLDSPSVGDSTFEQGLGSMSISDNKQGDCQSPQEKNNKKDISFAVEEKEADWLESLSPLDCKVQNANLRAGSSRFAMRKVAIFR